METPARPATSFPATDLEDAYRSFDRRNRMAAGQLRQLYQERSGHHSLVALLRELRLAQGSRTHLHRLYMGPSGCGKSTDLAWLVAEIEKQARLREELLIVHYGIGQAVGTYEIGFAEVALSMVLQVYETLEKKQVAFAREPYLEQIYRWLFGEEESREKTETGKRIEAGGSLLGVLKGALYGRVVREKDVELRVLRLLPELHELVEKLFLEVQELTGKRLLFIVDDLEKLAPLDMTLGLFLNHGGFFGGLPCHLVLTAPGSLRLEDRYQNDVLCYFKEVRALLSSPVELQAPHALSQKLGGEPTAEMEALRQLVGRRMARELADPEAIDEVIVRTGGLLAQLIDVMNRAVLLALVDEAERVEVRHVREALKEVASRYYALLRESDYQTLDDLATSGLRSHVERPELLHNLSVLEYPDDPSHFAIHPLVVPLLERWQRAPKPERKARTEEG